MSGDKTSVKNLRDKCKSSLPLKMFKTSSLPFDDEAELFCGQSYKRENLGSVSDSPTVNKHHGYSSVPNSKKSSFVMGNVLRTESINSHEVLGGFKFPTEKIFEIADSLRSSCPTSNLHTPVPFEEVSSEGGSTSSDLVGESSDLPRCCLITEV